MNLNIKYYPSCSVIIRSFNEEKYIGRLLIGIMEQTIKDVEIILVDSGSTDATVAIASQFPVKVVNIEPSEFSFGRALNRGCEVATGDILVNVSAHAYPVFHDWLEHILTPFNNPKVGLVYGKQRGGETTKYAEHQVFSQWFPEETDLIQSHPFCNNANAAVRRSLWQEQKWDENLTGLEDIDWATKILKKDYHLVYSAKALIIHIHEESSRIIYNRFMREAIAHKVIIPEQRFSLWDFVRLTTTNTVSDYFYAWHDGLFLKNIVGIVLYRILQHWGAYRGFKSLGKISKKLKKSFYYPRGYNRSDPQKEQLGGKAKIEYDQSMEKHLNV